MASAEGERVGERERNEAWRERIQKFEVTVHSW
jgi:hypothetical protein